MRAQSSLRRGHSVLLALTFCVWVVGIVVGGIGMIAYATVPEPSGKPPAIWPDESIIRRADDVHTVVMFVHPHCTCTNASFEELRRALAGLRWPVRAVVVLTVPPGVSEAWHKAHRWSRDIASIGAEVEIDRGGVEAVRFGATTSGHVVLYRPDGSLAFSGGVTPARGHEGDNRGRHAIIATVNGGVATADRAAVFGCPLVSRPSRPCCDPSPETDPCAP